MPIIDLSFPIRPHFRWKVEPTLRSAHARGDIFQSTILTITCHAYTHVDAPVHFLPTVVAQTGISHIVGQCVLEGIVKVGKKLRGIEKFGRLQFAENASEFILAETGDLVQQRQRNVMSDN